MLKYNLLVIVISSIPCIASDEKGKTNSGMPLLSVSHVTHSIETPKNPDYPNLSTSQVFLLKEVETLIRTIQPTPPSTPPPSPDEERTKLLKDVEEVVEKNQTKMMWTYSSIMVGGILICYAATKVSAKLQ